MPVILHPGTAASLRCSGFIAKDRVGPTKSKRRRVSATQCHREVQDLTDDEFEHHGEADCPSGGGASKCQECSYRRNRKLWKSCTLVKAEITHGKRMSWLAFKKGA